MCAALARACGGSPAWALALLREHPGTFDSFWRASFPPPRELPGGEMSPGDIDSILGRT